MGDAPSVVGVIGASSLVGGCAIAVLAQQGQPVVAFSRKSQHLSPAAGVTWRQLSSPDGSDGHSQSGPSTIRDWLCLAPIWALPVYFPMLAAHGARRVVALSSTSRFTKLGSSELADSDVAVRLAQGEADLKAWANENHVEWVVLRPTLIYGFGRDKNLSEIARFIRRFSFFPVIANATGLRQPIHAQDVAFACVAALRQRAAANRAYNIAGQEALPYQEMVRRIFVASGLRPRLITIPLFVFGMALAFLRVLPRYRSWSVAMAERMHRDMVFDCSEATRDLGFKPRAFTFSADDLPK